MLFEVLLAASSMTSVSYDDLRTRALAEENTLPQEQRTSWYPLKFRLFNEAVPNCLNGPMKRNGVDFKAVAIVEHGQIKDWVLATESRDTKCIARQLRGKRLPPLLKTPKKILFEMTFTPA